MATYNLNIIVESNVPFIKGLLEPYANVRHLESEDITPEAVKDAHAMIVRTRTHCNAALLDGSQCRFIATATIGLDHIDRQYCACRKITAVNAPGCNAPAVAQYVFGSLMRLINRPSSEYTIGIIGVGAVGSIVERWARSLGMKVMPCDPPRQRAEGGSQWATLAQIAETADIVTFHTPLTRDGQEPTFHLIDDAFVNSLRRSPIIINAARGAVADTEALIKGLDLGLISHAVIDCWEGEPGVPLELLRRAEIATPHIAGYSLQGKMRASQMALDALTGYFSLPRLNIDADLSLLRPTPARIRARQAYDSYDPTVDTAALKAAPDKFETLRNTYPLRNEI